jgi:hypothetical protein
VYPIPGIGFARVTEEAADIVDVVVVVDDNDVDDEDDEDEDEDEEEEEEVIFEISNAPQSAEFNRVTSASRRNAYLPTRAA